MIVTVEITEADISDKLETGAQHLSQNKIDLKAALPNKSTKKKEKKKKKKAKNMKGIQVIASQEIKEDEIIELEQILEKSTVGENNSPAEILDRCVHAQEDVKKENVDEWTEVFLSKKKKNHSINAGKAKTFHQARDEKPRKMQENVYDDKKVSEETTAKSKVKAIMECKVNNINEETKTTKPLEEIKDLFFVEKPVEIVELPKVESTEKSTKKRSRPKAQSRRAFLSQANKVPQQGVVSCESKWGKESKVECQGTCNRHAKIKTVSVDAFRN